MVPRRSGGYFKLCARRHLLQDLAQVIAQFGNFLITIARIFR